ncbi:MAG TPA: Gfo/Idh/MocA family oxidoreductase [Terriglobales bacterium]|nr:Gfo/Idh/MocA family oxidoreductase [Terriglobales bacterium]
MVRFGIVGFGLHAVKRLMPGFALAKNCKVTALSRRDLGQARESARQFQIPLAFDSVAELARSPEVDAIFVTTPNSLHLLDVLAAVDAGKAVLCEKPLAMNAAEARQMVEAARRKSVRFGVAQIFRFDESVRIFRERVASGAVGKPLFARSEFSFFADPSHPRKWLYDAKVAGAGPVFDIGVHCIDTLRFVLQDEVARVSATANSDERSGDVESAAALTLEFSRGTIGTVLVSFRAEYRTPFEIVGEKAVLGADDALTVERPIEIQLRHGKEIMQRETVSNRLAYALQVDAFADWMEGKAQFPCPGEEGWQNQEILDAALRSVKSGKAEAVARIG